MHPGLPRVADAQCARCIHIGGLGWHSVRRGPSVQASHPDPGCEYRMWREVVPYSYSGDCIVSGLLMIPIASRIGVPSSYNVGVIAFKRRKRRYWESADAWIQGLGYLSVHGHWHYEPQIFYYRPTGDRSKLTAVGYFRRYLRDHILEISQGANHVINRAWSNRVATVLRIR